MNIFRRVLVAAVVIVLGVSVWAQAGSKSSDEKPSLNVSLNDGWALQSSAKVPEKGETIATTAFLPKNWIKATVPTTVVAAQVKSGALPNPFEGMNLRNYPGVSYPVGANFSNLPLPPDSPYAVSWWYRKEFTLPKNFAGKTVWLNFRGINYRGNIWVNGKQIAGMLLETLKPQRKAV
jgi:exo-1,4-beta-D-glucosaminidase